jgi:hypothetical protein
MVYPVHTGCRSSHFFQGLCSALVDIQSPSIRIGHRNVKVPVAPCKWQIPLTGEPLLGGTLYLLN